ncbi:hypothetical protein PR003_g8074 [Phytophthora rubi]|uniref:RxLR effector protein n=1 Tax=Phytophthora rubi TaxID=129364 RepID=A0A6A4FS40_9STRA|nr:hypothetical protein PR002_g14859 [Phytophthora rubi]KAE9345164.1 hypothetical protein PR003_g8074 [Phytophthora rubi]
MRLTSFLVLATAALLACVDIVSADKVTKTITRNTMADTDYANELSASKRMLRTYDENDEERAGPGKIVDLVKSSTSKLADSAKMNKYLLFNKNGVQVLNKMKLGDDVGAALKSSKMNALAAYIDLFNKKHPNNKISMIGTLTARYGDDAVADALVSAQRYLNTETLAKQLRKDQLAAWLEKDKSVYDVFKLLKLGDDSYYALSSRKLEVLEDYISLFNREKYFSEKTLLSTLTVGFGGETKLAKLLVGAKENPFSREKAMGLESALFNKWLASKKQPETVFKDLRLDVNLELSLIGTITAHYGDDIVAKALVSARTAPSTEWMATRLQSQQLEGWLKSGKSVDDVYALLKLKDDGVAAIVSRKLETLDAYIKLFNREKSADESLIKAMATGFGGEDKLATTLANARLFPLMHAKATQLQKAQFAQWLDEGYDSISVLTKIFKVEEANLAGASRSQKSIAKKFKAFYERERGVPNVVSPRRS